MERATSDCAAASPRRFGRGILALLFAGGLFLASAPAPAAERHYPDTGGVNPAADAEGNCYKCHTLDVNEGALNTNYIQRSTRTMVTILQKGAAPDHLGCTFCHYSLTSTSIMKEVFTHFSEASTTYLSKHPVGRRYDTEADTDGEYFSTIDSNAANELDCIDCHDPALLAPTFPTAYIGHQDKTNPARQNNLKMLRGGVAAVGAYDDLCRLCHGAGMMAPVTSHPDGSNGNPILEDDNTRLRTTPAVNPQNDKTQCTKCHDTHYSENVKFFNDGHEADTAIDGADCTAVCHFPGDENSGYDNHGHNKGQSTYKYNLGVVNFASGSTVGLSMPCTACHASLDTANPGTRIVHVRGPVGADNPTRYLTRFNLDKQPIPVGDDGSIYGNPLRGICVFCHQTYEEHVVNTAGASDVGCQDCHDEHAEGSGVGSNVFMIPERSKANGVYNPSIPGYVAKAGTEAVSFATPRFQSDGTSNSPNIDFYKGATSTGVCDNSECHAKWGANLQDLMTTGGTYDHSGPTQTGGLDCGVCHQHNGDALGGWRAQDSCNDCHAANGLNHSGANEDATTHNTTHAAGPFITNCADCHSHRGEIPVGTAPHGTGVIDFKAQASGGKLDNTLNYPVGSFPNTNCSSVNGCHDSDAGEWKAGNLGADACEDCHDAGTKGSKDAGKTLDQGWWTSNANGSARHMAHINASGTYVPTDCDSCHGANASSGDQGVPPGALHRNGTLENTVSYVAGSQTCTISCHGVAAGDWTAGGTLTCMECHTGAYIGGGANQQVSGLHATSETDMTSQNRHDDSWRATPGGVVGSATCVTCHTAAPSTAHINGTLAAGSITFDPLVGFSASPAPSCGPNGALSTCHTDGGAWMRWWSATADDNNANECDNCHGMFKGAIGTGDNTWVSGISPRHSGTDANGGVEANHTNTPSGGPCFQCHTADTVGGQTYYTFGTQHRDGTIQLNNQNGFTDNGANVGCSGCHAANGYVSFADGEFVMADTLTGSGGLSRWARMLQNGPVGNCSSCHDNIFNNETGSNAHVGANKSLAAHDTTHNPASAYIDACDDCHTNNGPSTGTGHSNGTVNFRVGGRLSSTLDYARAAAFSNTNCNAVNGCHDADVGEWAANNLGADACADCHRSGTRLLGVGTAPTSGLHAATATSVTNHDEALSDGNGGNGTGCTECHADLTADPATHKDGTLAADAAGNTDRFLTRANLTYSDLVPNSATCSGTGLPAAGCHTDGGNWSRLWSTAANADYKANPSPAQAVCNVCHGQYGTLATSTGWRAGTSHYRAGAAGAAEDKGQMHTDALPATCEDCHAYTSGGAARHEDGSITFSDGAPTSYTATYAATPNRWYCATCHNGNSTEDPTLTTTHTFPDSLAFPGPTRANHVNGTSEPEGNCSGCHGGDNAAWTNTPNYWPAAGAIYPRRAGEHSVHIAQLMTKLGYLVATITDLQQKALCGYCHNDSLGVGNGGHNDNVPTADVGSFNRIWDGLADSAAVGSYTPGDGLDGVCSNVDCHNNRPTLATPTAYDWYDVSSTACVMCHADIENAGNATGRSHQAHGTTTTGGSNICSDCHAAATWGTPGTAPGTNHLNGTFLVSGSQPFTYSGVYPTLGTCGVNICHNNGRSTTAVSPYTWGTQLGGATNSCTECHNAGSTTLVTSSHPQHLTAATLFGVDGSSCGGCHAAATLATHANGSVTFNGLFTYTVGADVVAVNGGVFGSCGVNLCHNNGQSAAATSTYTWNTPLPNCTICHQGGTAMATNAHAEHLNNGYAGATCTDCHTPETAGTHINGSTNINAASTYSRGAATANDAAATGTCATANCHNGPPGTNQSEAWDTAGNLLCDDCHFAATGTTTGVANNNHFAPLSPSHNKHFDKDKVCTNCHGAAPPDTGHIGGRTSLADGATAALGEASVPFTGAVTTYSYESGGHTCYTPGNNGLGCHATAGATGAADPTRPDWDTPFTDCTSYCHTNTTSTLVNPTSGLHHMTAANVTSHDGTLDDGNAGNGVGCTECHADLTADPATHINGTLIADAAGNTDRFITRTNLTFSDLAPDSATCSGTGLQAAGCHRDAGNWARLWSTAANADYSVATGNPSPAQAVCNVCHGQYSTIANSTGWRAGTAHYRAGAAGATEDKGLIHTDTAPASCEDCHAYTSGIGALHDSDSKINFSDGAPTTYTATYAATPNRWYCRTCHNANSSEDPTLTTSHTFPDSLAFPGLANTTHTNGTSEPGGCSSCHGNSANGNYWPDQGGYPDLAGAHLNHVNAIGMWLYGEDGNTPGSGLFIQTGEGDSDTKQRTICSWCHPNPGSARAGKAGETGHDDNGTWATPADVHGDGTVAGTYQQYFNGNIATPGSVNDTDATYASGTRLCSNANCHNQVTTPSSWNTPPVWNTTGCQATQCHSGASAAVSGKHVTHIGAAAKNYACAQCHALPTGTATEQLRHGNGQVNLSWTTGLEDGDGFYDHNVTGTSDPLDNGFTPAYDGAAANFSCYNMYCHGDFTGGLTATPTWNGTAACGTCHNSTTATIGSGSHPTHFNTVYGAALTACGTCHTASSVTTASHANGTVSFETRKIAPPNTTATNLAGTGVCDACHGNAAGGGAAWMTTLKSEWPTQTVGNYTDVTCESCHGQYDLANSSADNTGFAAPDMMGNGSTYGATINGHGKTSGSHDSGDPAANRACVVCHLYTKSHSWGADSTGYTSLRIQDTINSVPLGGTYVEDACKACHQNAGGGGLVSTHGNTNLTFQATTLHDGAGGAGQAENFVYRCDACHEPHGLTLNSNTPAAPNMYMVKASVEVKNYSTPASGADETTVIPVFLEARTGANSFDNNDGSPTNNVCVTCHINAGNPGSGTTLDNTAGNGSHSGLSDYSTDERGNNCTSCHSHNWDATANNADGFMAQQCNACHSYPGLALVGGTHQLSAVHDIHAGAPGVAGAPNYNYPCRTCHFNNPHNNITLMVPGGVWGPLNSSVDIRFDPARNGGTPTYAGNNAYGASIAPGNGGTGTCAGLYCHGDASPFPTANDGGSDTTPEWNNAATADCGDCHRYTAASGPTHGSHTQHVASSAGNYGIVCQACHYQTTNNGTAIASMALHVNNEANVSFDSAGDARVHSTSSYVGGDVVVGSGYGSCSLTYCHSKGTDLTAPYDASGAPATALVWGAAGGCGDCHGTGGSSSQPDYPDTNPKANKHDKHVTTSAFGCQICHYTTTQNGTAIVSTTAHVNATYTVAANATPTEYFFTWASAGSTCNAVACHGGNGSLTWALSGPYSCDICHGEVNGAVTDTDVNNFAWGGATPAISKISNAEYTAATTGGHGSSSPRAINKACNACHDSNAQHDTTAALTGTNPFRLSATGMTCSTASGCHVSGNGPATGEDISTFVTHSDERMANPGLYTAKRTWPAWNPRCTECHDPHGDTNLSMIQRELYDHGSSVQGVNTGSEDWGIHASHDNSTLVFTDNSTGADASGVSFADTNAPFSSLCQECHEAADIVSFHDETTGFSTGHPTGSPLDCSECHSHTTAFRPLKCEECHNGNVDYPLAPNVIDGVLPTNPTLNYNWYGNQAGKQDGGHGDADVGTYMVGQTQTPRPNTWALQCDECHELGATHLNDVYNSVFTNSNRTANTAHLKPGYFPGGASDWSTQLNFDNYCNNQCHTRVLLPIQVPTFVHGNNTVDGPGVVHMGLLSTQPDGEALGKPFPMDHDLSTNANSAQPHYAPCVSCHDPHGTTVVEPKNNNVNVMLREVWETKFTLCVACH